MSTKSNNNSVVQFDSGDNETILVEIFSPGNIDDAGEGASLARSGTARGALDSASAIERLAINDITNGIKPLLQGISAAVREVDIRPDELELSFGIKLTASAGVVLTKLGSEATINLKMKWTTKKSKSEKDKEKNKDKDKEKDKDNDKEK